MNWIKKILQALIMNGVNLGIKLVTVGNPVGGERQHDTQRLRGEPELLRF